MTLVEALLAIGTGAVGSGIVEFVSRWSKSSPSNPPTPIEPEAVLLLARNQEYCRHVVTLYGELGRLIEQLSIVYCELIGISDDLDERTGALDPATGSMGFVPASVRFFWQNIYRIGVAPDELENRLDDPRYGPGKERLSRLLSFRRSVTPETVLRSSRKIHELLTGAVAHSKESAALFDSVGEVIYQNVGARTQGFRATLVDDTGQQLRFYTVWQDNRFIATEQAMAILARSREGGFRKRLKSSDRASAHHLILAVFSATGFLLETAATVLHTLTEQDGSRIGDARTELHSQYSDLWTVGF